MLDTIKKFGIGTYISLVVAVLSLIALIIYGVNVSSPGHFKGMVDPSVIWLTIVSIVLLIGTVAAELFIPEQSEMVDKVMKLAVDVLRVLAVVLLAICFINFLADRVEGFGFIFYSDANLDSETKTTDNLASASTAITGLVFYGLAWLTSVVGSVFALKRSK